MTSLWPSFEGAATLAPTSKGGQNTAAAHIVLMTSPTTNQMTQPRGENGHPAGAYSEKTPTPLPVGSELHPAGNLDVLITDILPGDTLFDDAGELIGVALTVGSHPMAAERIRVRLSGGAAISAEPTDVVRVDRADVAPAYDTADMYDIKLIAAHHALATEETLEQVLAHESEDDFMHAVASHRNASPIQIDRASRHHSYLVRQAAIDNPHTGISTLRRLSSQASSERRRTAAKIVADGLNPGTESLRWTIDQCALIEAHAREALVMRGHH